MVQSFLVHITKRLNHFFLNSSKDGKSVMYLTKYRISINEPGLLKQS